MILSDLIEHGFLYHPLSPKQSHIAEQAMHQTQEFFKLSQEEKNSFAMSKDSQYRGYTPLGGESTNGVSDCKETLDFGPETEKGLPLHGPNIWPENLQFKKAIERYYQLCVSLGEEVLSQLGQTLFGRKDFFKAQFQGEPFCLLRLLSYPATEQSDNQGIGAHTDYGCLVFLLQDEIGGLEVEGKKGCWSAVKPVPKTLIVSGGDMLSLWTKGRVKALNHRVRGARHAPRHSLAFFYEPGFDTIVAGADGKQLHYGTYLQQAFARSFPQFS